MLDSPERFPSVVCGAPRWRRAAILHGRIVEHNLAAFPAGVAFVVYCSGPHCNGADKAAVRLARLNRKVKEMLGGIAGWKWEGFELE